MTNILMCNFEICVCKNFALVLIEVLTIIAQMLKNHYFINILDFEVKFKIGLNETLTTVS